MRNEEELDGNSGFVPDWFWFLQSEPPAAKKLVINLGYASSEGSTYAVLADKFAELAEKYSNGEH